MAKAYREYKVSELKEILSGRGLAVSGTKNELIARLEENDASREQETAADAAAGSEGADEASAATSGESPATESQTPAKTKEVPEHQPVEAAVAPESATKAESSAAAEDEPQIDPAEAAIADLEKQIARRKRFGEDYAELETQIARIKRFGYTPPKKLAVSGFKFRNKRFRKRESSLKLQ